MRFQAEQPLGLHAHSYLSLTLLGGEAYLPS